MHLSRQRLVKNDCLYNTGTEYKVVIRGEMPRKIGGLKEEISSL
jgi:hypothetical protein